MKKIFLLLWPLMAVILNAFGQGYQFPFEVGKSIYCGRGNGAGYNDGYGTHTDTYGDYYSWDFSVGRGTPIYATKSGTVWSYRETDPNDYRVSRTGNFIWLKHDDGTASMYHHLNPQGVVVSLNQHVNQGQLIGYSGNSGNSSGDHLHFMVTGSAPGYNQIYASGSGIPFSSTSNKTIPIEFCGIGVPVSRGTYVSKACQTSSPRLEVASDRNLWNDIQPKHLEKGNSFSINTWVYNGGSADFNGWISVDLYQGSNYIAEIAKDWHSINSNQNKNIIITRGSLNVAVGDYTVKLRYSESGNSGTWKTLEGNASADILVKYYNLQVEGSMDATVNYNNTLNKSVPVYNFGDSHYSGKLHLQALNKVGGTKAMDLGTANVSIPGWSWDPNTSVNFISGNINLLPGEYNTRMMYQNWEGGALYKAKNSGAYNWVNSGTLTVKSPQSLEEGIYIIRNKNSGKPLMVWNNNDPIYQHDYTQASQKIFFNVTKNGNGFYNITLLHNGKSIDLPQSSLDIGKDFSQYYSHGGDNQTFGFVPVGDGSYIITVKHSALALDIEGGSVNTGAKLQQYPPNGSDAQRFYMEKQNLVSNGQLMAPVHGLTHASKTHFGSKFDLSFGVYNTGEDTYADFYAVVSNNSTSIDTIPVVSKFLSAGFMSMVTLSEQFVEYENGSYSIELFMMHDGNTNSIGTSSFEVEDSPNQLLTGIYTIRNINSQKVLDIEGGSSANGAALQQYGANGTKAQQFFVQKISAHAYALRPLNSLKCIETPSAEPVNSVNLIQNEYLGNDRQLWYILQNSDGTYRIISKANLLAMDVENSETASGALIQQFTPNNTGAQKFIFDEVTDYLPLDGMYTIGTSSENYLSIQNGATSNGAAVVLEENTQPFALVKNTDGYYTIKSYPSMKAIDLSNQSDLILYTHHGGANQQWKLIYNPIMEGYYILSKENGFAINVGSELSVSELSASTTGVFKLNSTEVTPTEGFYTIVNKNSQLLLDVTGASIDNGAEIQQYPKNHSFAQYFFIDDLGTGFYQIRNFQSGKNFSTGETSVNGMVISQWAASSSYAQQYRIVFNAKSEGFELISRYSGKNLGIASASTIAQANLVLGDKTNSADQAFSLNPVNFNKLEEGFYYIKNAEENSYLDIESRSLTNGAEAVLWAFTGYDNQKFELINNGDNTYSILAQHSGKALDHTGDDADVGTPIHQWDYFLNFDNQKFYILPTDGDKYMIYSVNTFNSLTVETNGNAIVQGNPAAIDLQKFIFEPSSSSSRPAFETLLDPAKFGGQSENEMLQDINIYPNPFYENLTIDLSAVDGETLIILKDISGKEVLSKRIDKTQYQVNLSGLEQGVYILYFKGMNFTKTAIVIKE